MSKFASLIACDEWKVNENRKQEAGSHILKFTEQDILIGVCANKGIDRGNAYYASPGARREMRE